MSSWKRSVAAVLSAVMLLSCLPGTVFATDAEEMDTLATLEAPQDMAPEDTDATAQEEKEADTPDNGSLQSILVGPVTPPAPKPDNAGKIDLTDIYEVGYRFGEDDTWHLIGIKESRAGSLEGRFDDNGNYAIRLSKVWDKDTEKYVSPFPLKVYVMVWDSKGVSMPYPQENSPFDVQEATANPIEVKGDGYHYTLSFYAPWLETFSYSGKSLNGDTNAVSATVTSDEAWYNAHSKTCFYLQDNAHTVELRRDTDNPYTNPFPYTLTFQKPYNADDDFKFQFTTKPGQDVTTDTDNNQVTFNKSGTSVTVNGYEFTLVDTLSGEVTYSGVGNSLPTKTLGEKAEWEAEHKETYEVPASKNYLLKLGKSDKFPFSVRFTLRGETASRDIFQGMEADKVEFNNNDSSILIFKQNGASVKVGAYTFTVQDDRAGEVIYEFGDGTSGNPRRLVRVGMDADAAEQSPLHWNSANTEQTGYVQVKSKSHPIELLDTDTFPLRVTFSLPRDEVTELKAQNVTGGTEIESNKNQVTVEFSQPDASVTIGSYAFTLHSSFADAVRYTIQGRSVIVGTDEKYAKDLKDAKTALNEAEKAQGTNSEAYQEAERTYRNTRKSNADTEYACFKNGAYTIELNDGEYFPRPVTFQKWDAKNGWTLPKDSNGQTLPKEAEERKSVEQDLTFDGVTSTVNAFGHTFSVHAYWLEEVKYQFNDKSNLKDSEWVTVGNDAARAQAGVYELFDESGNFAINPDDELIFPCTVTFRVRNASGSHTDTEQVFENSTVDSTVKVREHTFSLRVGWKGEIVYTVNGQSKIAGYDTAWAETHKDDYDAVTVVYDETDPQKVISRSFVINVDDVTYPVKVKFHLRGSEKETELEFKNPDDEQKYQGVYFSVHPKWLDEVTYTVSKKVTLEDGSQVTRFRDITIGTDKTKADAAQIAAKEAEQNAEARKNNPLLSIPNYQLPAPDKDGVITIQLPEDNAFYPYGLEFKYSRVKKADDGKLVREENPTAPEKVWFASPEDVQEVGGYKFKVTSNRTDPNQLISAGLWVGVKFDADGNRVAGKYVPLVRYDDREAYWNDKKAKEDYEASLQSLLPLRERRLYANLSGYFPWELENVQLVFQTPTVSGKRSAVQTVAWSKTVGGDSSGDYDLIPNGALLRDKAGNPLLKNYDDNYGGTYEMIVGQLNQINQADIPDEDIRYIIQTETNWTDFSREFYPSLRMKMSYAEESRAGVRVDYLGTYNRSGGSYQDPETKEKHGISSCDFTVIEQWQDGEVFLTLWPANTDNAAQMDAEALKKAYPGLTPAIYQGAYLTVDALNKAGDTALDVTSLIWGQELDMQPPNVRYKTNLVANTTEGAPYLTFVWLRDGVPVTVHPFQILVNVEKEVVWTYDPEDGDLEDTMPANQISMGVPKTSNDAVGGYWQFDAVEPQEEEATHAKVYEYTVPRNASFKGVGTDRFYVSAYNYTHHIKAGELNSKGETITTPLTESENKTYTFRSTRSDITSYVGEQFYATKEEADKAVTDGTAKKVELHKAYDGSTKIYTYSYANENDYTQDERHSFFSKGELINRFVWNTDAVKKYQVKVYAGSKPYDTIEQAKADKNAQDVTAQLLGGGYGAQYTKTIYFSFFDMGGKRFECYGVRVKSEIRVSYDTLALNGDPTFNPGIPATKEETDEKTGLKTTTYTYTMPDGGYPESGLYSVRVHYLRDNKELNPKDENFTILVSESDLSALTLEKALAYGKDVTLEAIQDPGYTTNYSSGVHFYVYDADGKLFSHDIFITKPYVEPAKSKDTYFHITGALDASKRPYYGFAMPYTADAYYSNGYQTVFLMDIKKDKDGNRVDKDGNPLKPGDPPTYIPIQKDTDFYPVFESKSGVTIYGMFYDQGDIQKSGENRQIFDIDDEHPTKILNYSAAAANGTHLRNYWVTFLTQQTGKAELFVNTANDSSHWLTEKDANGKPVIMREVFINDPTGSHDIFFANIGDKRLENIKVTLSDESAVYLDEYWKVPRNGETPNRYLDAYDTVETKDLNGEQVNYGGIPNIAKIRIFAKNPKEAKSIHADLTISGTYDDNGTQKSVSQTIHLSGMVGDVKIVAPVNAKLRDAVKWVPYANLISTNNIYGGSTVQFSITQGKLPNGMELRPNGEVYGTPTETGEFKFTVTANFQYGEAKNADSKEYTLTVRPNTDDNVWWENDWNAKQNEEDTEGDGQYFGVEHWVPDMEIEGTEAEFDHSTVIQSPASQGDSLNTEISTDERRHRDTSAGKVEPQKLKKYQDVVFAIKNYSPDNVDGEHDFDWFIDLWLNGKRLKGICLEEGQPFTDEMRSVYDFYYRRGSLLAVATGEAIEKNAIKDGKTDNTISGEFRHNKDTKQRQDTGAGNFKVKGPGKKNTPSNPTPTPNPRPTPNPQPTPNPTPTPTPSSGGGGGGGGGGTTPKTTYKVTISNASNGSVTTSVKKAAEGETVTITMNPNNGYELDTVTVKTSGKKGTSVSVSGQGNSRTFRMPASAVTVSATFAKLYRVSAMRLDNGWVEVTPEGYVRSGTKITLTAHPESGFKAERLRAYDGDKKAIDVQDNGDGTATFTMPASLVEASADFVPLTIDDIMAKFTDIKPSDWFYQDAAWAVEREIMNGVTPATWVPQDNISTSTMVRTLFRLSMSGKTEDERNTILGEYASDIYAENRPWLPDSSQGYYREARWAAANHILTENVFTGNDPISRAKFAIILRNYLRYRGVQVEVPTPYEFSDMALIDEQGRELGENLNEAFQILRAADVFRGDRTNAMLPGNYSTRAHMAALLHRLADFIAGYEKRWVSQPNAQT